MTMHDFGVNGFIAIDKPAGMTSFDVIRELRKLLRIKKLGHSGVLDRPAMGVLVVGAGQATRLFDLFGSFEKEYEADIWLGLNTATDDLMGELVATGHTAPCPASDGITAALQTQIGEIDQLPPAYSLTKVDGKELYRYALAGQEVIVQPKRVRIHSIEVLADEPGAEVAQCLPPDSRLDVAALPAKLRKVTVRVRCHGGVYIRSIARDLGAQLGCGGCLGRLVRTQVGPFKLADALTLEQVADQLSGGMTAAQLIQPTSSIACSETSVQLDSSQLALIANGRSIRRNRQQLPSRAQRGSMLYGVTGHDSADSRRRLAAVLQVGDTNPQGFVELRPSKVLLWKG